MLNIHKFEIKLIKSVGDWEIWDEFIYNLKFTSFLSYSFWLDSYILIPLLIRKIGFVLVSEGQILGGIAGIQIGFWPIKFTIFPSGPFFDYKINSTIRESFCKNIFLNSKIKNSRLIQIAVREENNFDTEFISGKAIRKIYLDPGIGMIYLENNLNDQLNSLDYKIRRYVKAALKRDLFLKVVENPQELVHVYKALKKNADENKYRIRPFWMYKNIWKKSLKSRKSIFFLIFYNNEIKGAAWFIDSGKMLNYIMGGSSKEKPRLDIGYFIHWNAMRLSIEHGYKCYNISVGGSRSVESFKDDFGRIKIKTPKYYYK